MGFVVPAMVHDAVLLAEAAVPMLGRSAGGGPHESSLSLLPIANEPLAVHVARGLESAGLSRLSIVVAPALRDDVAAAIEAGGPWNMSISCVEADGALAGQLAAVRDAIGDRAFLLHLGDSIATPHAIAGLLEQAPAGDRSAVIPFQREPARRDLRVVRLETGLGGPAARRSAGAYVLGPQAFAAAAGPAAEAHADRDRQVLAMIERLTTDGGTVTHHRVDAWWRHRPGAEALLEANRFALEGQRANYDPASLDGSRIEGAVVVSKTARLSSCVARGPAIIGAGADLTDAYVGPYTAVGAGVRIDGAEIENSILLPGASISQLGCRLEGSVIGAGARVRRDFRLPRALRLDVGSEARISVA